MDLKYLIPSPSLAAVAADFAYGRRFIAWIGSGISVSAGLPTWSGLRVKLENRLDASTVRRMPGLTEEQRRTKVSQIRSIPNNWDAFSVLKSLLGSDYQQIISTLLNDGLIGDPPEQLCRIWGSGGFDGIVSLNVDNFCQRAFAQVNRGRRSLTEATGNDLGAGLRFLGDTQPFSIRIHGRLQNPDSWVFTRGELDNLLNSPNYNTFVRAVLTGRRVIFFGCSPDDEAVRHHFLELAKATDLLPLHFWLVPSHEVDKAREDSLGVHGINIIEYRIDRSIPPTEQNKAHVNAFNEFFDYVEKFQYSEDEPDPINPLALHSGARLPPEIVQSRSPEQARNLLSRYASEILESGEGSHERYQRFLTEYGPAIAVASYVPRAVGTLFFGHTIVGEVGAGAFSRVLKAASPAERTMLAIKLVRSEVRDDPIMLRSFRRGVKSMKIVSDKNINGMVTYVSAHEIPPCVFMPFISGSNLEQYVAFDRFSFLDEGLPILKRVAEIVSSAHQLPERVLHRDIRPSNIMITDHSDTVEVENRVVVLDFDLSWHEGADSDSPISPNMTTVLAYLAPEQINQDTNIIARNSRVDTYGLCMTLYFVLEKSHPDIGLRDSSRWESVLARLGTGFKTGWLSFQARLRRLIHDGTVANQESRIDFQVVLAEIRTLDRVKGLSLISISVEMAMSISFDALCEEVFSFGLGTDRYKWSSRDQCGTYMGALGVVVAARIVSMKGGRALEINISKMSDGTQSFNTIRKYWRQKKGEIVALLSKAEWIQKEAKAASREEVSLSFFAYESEMIHRLGLPGRLARGLASAWRKIGQF